MQLHTMLQKQHSETPAGRSADCAAGKEVLVEVQHVSKKFCRDLKKSLWYGVKDVLTEINPWQPRRAPEAAATSGDGLRPGEFWAVNDVSFQLRRGECLGLIGHNGAGKTTLLKMLNGLIKPDQGRITMRGRVGALIALGAGFNPILTGRENVYVNGAILGLSKKEIDERIESIIDFAEIGEFIDAPVQSYSSGMQVRLGFAVATAMKPDVLILDEVLAVGDATFRTKCFVRVSQLLEHAAVIFVSHSEEQLTRICKSGLLMDHGRVACAGKVGACLEAYREKQRAVGTGIEAYHDSSVQQVELRLGGGEHISGEDLPLELHYTVEAPVRLSLHVLTLVDESGAVVAACNLLPVFPAVASGDHFEAFHIRSLSLRPGAYTFGIEALSDQHGSIVVRKRFEHRIQVKNSIAHFCSYTPAAARAAL